MKMFRIELFLFTILYTILQIQTQLFQVTSLGSYISNNFTLVNGVTYDLNFSMTSVSITAGSTVGLKFSDRFYITIANLLNCNATTSSSSSPTTVPCSVNYYSGASVYEVIFTGIFPTSITYSYLRLTFQIPNPYGQFSQPINLTIYHPNNTMVGYGIAYISTYKASVMNNCSILSASMMTGANATHTYSFTPTQRLILNSYLLIQLPVWSGTTGNQVTNYPICTGLQGTDQTTLSCSIFAPVTTQTLNITSGIVSANRSASSIVLSIADLRNPWSVEPFGPITVSIMSGTYLTQVCYNVYNTVTNPNSLSVFTFSLSNLAIGATNSNVRLVFFPVNPFPRPNNRVTLQFSSQLSVSYSGSITVFSQNSTQITLSGVTVFSISGFTVINPPSTRSFTFKATTYVVNNGIAYAIQTRSISNATIVGAITSGSATATNSQVNAITTYTITFTITNRLQSSSFINIIFPTQLNIQTGSASCSITGQTCAIISSRNVSVTLGSAVAAASSLTVTVNSVKNAYESLTTSSFAIYSYFDSLYDSLVNQVTSGITVTMTPKILTPGSVTTSSLTTFSTTFYKIDQTLLDPIPAGGFIVITFPSTTTPLTPQLASASFTTSTCTLSHPSTNVINITGCFTSTMSNLALSLNISNIRNPPSFKPTDSFSLYIRGPSGATINYILSGLTVTMNVAATITSFTITPSSYLVAASTSYSFQISHSISSHSMNDYAIITIPALMTLPTTASCSTIIGASISCITVTNNQLKVLYLSIPATVIQFSLQSQTNYLIGDQPISYSVEIFNSDNYKMEEFLSQTVTYMESTLTSVTVNNDSNIALGQLSNITLTISNAFTLYPTLFSNLTQLQITIPPQLTIGTTCSSTGGTCSKISSSKYRVTGVGLFLSNLNVVMPNILLNYYNPTSSSFQVVYTYNGFNVSTKTSGIFTSIYCTSPCQRCSTSVTTCQSCLPTPNTMIYHDSQTKTCVSTCVAGKYPDSNNLCQLCVSPCANCLDAVNCSSCVVNMWLYQTSCLAICPSTYYNSSNGRCQSCQSPCNQCNSLTSCKNCITGYYSNNWCVNATNCPNGTYANSTTMACQNCQSPCANCQITMTNCTTCQVGYLYYSNNCVPNCPPGMYQSSIYCFPCVNPCATCTNSSICTSCLTNYLNANTGTCVDGSNCPSGTYPNSTNLQCMTCPTGCTACLNSTNCTSCNTLIYLFYNYACYSVCPPSTYKSGVICLDCTAPCFTCRDSDSNCLSCVAPKLFYANSCVDVCPAGTYNNNSTCTICLNACLACSSGTTCDSCKSPLFLQNGQCVSICSAGYYGNSATNSCISCTSPCSQCSLLPGNCTRCIAPQLQYQNGCVNSCPTTYFVINGSCKTCPNCVNCLDATTCAQCTAGYYLLNGICYTTCPSTAPIPDDITNTCGRCDSTCLTCYIIAKNCTSCYSNTFLYKGSCLTECPLSFIQDLVSGTCKVPLIGNVIYFPFSFLFLFFFFVAVASKCLFSQTENITTLSASISLCQFGSWCLFAYIVTVDYNLQATIITVDKFVSLACVLLSVGMGAAFIIAFYKQYEWDKGLNAWKQFQPSCVYSYRFVNTLSCLSFRFFRFLYGRLFNRTFLSMYIANGERFLTTSNRLTFISLITTTLPMIVISVYTLYKKEIYDQTFFCALDIVILGFFCSVILTIDSCKNKDHFQSIKDGLPFLKYKNMKNDQSMAGQSLLSRFGQERQRARSQINKKQKDELFKKITWLPNLNKFGHLNVLEDTPNDQDETKSLPQQNKLGQYRQFDPHRRSIIRSDNDKDDRVIDDLFFIQEEQQRRRNQQQAKRKQEQEKRRLQQQRNRLQQQQRRKLQQEQEQQQRRRLKRLQQQQEKRKRQQQQRRRRQLMEQDERQRVQLQFPDLAAIDKVENKNGKRKNPLDLLSNCKKVDEKPIDDKAIKKLQEIGKKNGIDPSFLKQTFGIEKNHNPQLLNQIIDKHHHVKRQSVKELFSDKNNPEILQQLFGKNSKMNPKKLREILNDPNSSDLIKKIANKQQGILSPEMAKQLFDQNSKFTTQFTKNLLSDDNGMDPQKLKELLKNNNGKGKDSPLKALMKIGGENLQNKKMLNNMMGQDAVLDPQNFTRVANDLSMKAIQNIFKNKNKNSDIITEKILNNKKINLKNLAPILQDQQLLQQLAQALGSGDENLQQNLINLFKNAQNIDPVKLKQLLGDPVIRQKLLNKPVDPSFLQSLLDKNSKSDLKILSQALKNMSDKSIQQSFKFDPEKNIDFKSLATLFDANPKTDPQLVAKMLEPDMVKKLYVKGNDTKMLNKLVQKGNQFDAEMIKNVYGDQKNNIFDTKTDNMNPNHLMNFDQDKGEEFRSQKDYSLGFQKNYKSQANMSRTAGGVLSFLTPIIPINNNKLRGRSKQFRQTQEDGWTSQGQQDDDDQQIQQEQSEQNMKGGRKKKVKKTKKKLVDIRHPAQEIYLQRIEAPHQHAVRKANIRKKKKKVQNPGVMDQDNDIFDMDF